MVPQSATTTGLQSDEVLISRRQHGSNAITLKEDRVFLLVLKGVLLEPMFVLLVVSCGVYFLLHQQREGFIMLVSIFIVAGISFFQEYRSRNAINALKKYSSSQATVVRDGVTLQVPPDEIVVGDLVLLKEGELVPADGLIISSNDFSVNESILTGEAFSIYKPNDSDSSVYKGTLVTGGSANINVATVGLNTRLGQIGTSLKNIEQVNTPLQIQIRSFVRNMAWLGAIAFLFVFLYNYYRSNSLTYGLLQGLTLAMSILPEEIPVAFSAFMALGAFRLMKHNIIVKQPQYVETLGSATVICVDKTGTITENRMVITKVYDSALGKWFDVDAPSLMPVEVIEYAMWSSETDPFDPMEKAIHKLYETTAAVDKRKQATQVHEYPLSGRPPLMTHIFKSDEGEMIVACKGAPEAILKQSQLSKAEQEAVLEAAHVQALNGFRVLGVGKAAFNKPDFPETQESFVFDFLGLITFYDPPKLGIIETIKSFNTAGINVKMITGDSPATAKGIAKEILLPGWEESISGDEVLEMPEEELMQKVKRVNIFARMFPEAKLKVVNALKANGEVVAMTGDGVNDGPALKAAQIGIAMGRKGSEVAKGAASLIITDDNLVHMTDAVAIGRKIYDNLQKAIQYIVSIHIPIILIVTMPLVLGWKFANIFSPVHVIFLELIMGPTCSIIYENEVMEAGTMTKRPRKLTLTFLTIKQLGVSIVQGLAIALGCLGLGYYFMSHEDETGVRTVIFITLLFCNVFLTLINRSFYYSILTTLRYRNWLMWVIIGCSIVLILCTLYLPAIRQLFGMKSLDLQQVLQCIAVALLSTIWIELYKWMKRRKGADTIAAHHS